MAGERGRALHWASTRCIASATGVVCIGGASFTDNGAAYSIGGGGAGGTSSGNAGATGNAANTLGC